MVQGGGSGGWCRGDGGDGGAGDVVVVGVSLTHRVDPALPCLPCPTLSCPASCRLAQSSVQHASLLVSFLPQFMSHQVNVFVFLMELLYAIPGSCVPSKVLLVRDNI